MDAQIKILEQGPDGKTQHRLGSGAVCWGCGHVGLPRNNDAFDAGKPKRCVQADNLLRIVIHACETRVGI